ncbi:MAG: acyl carrier protein [Christensenellales bacterium]
MSREEIKKKLEDISQKTIGVSLCEDESLKESGVDSLSLVTIIVSVEEEFGITFSDDDLQPENLKSLLGLVELTEKYL